MSPAGCLKTGPQYTLVHAPIGGLGPPRQSVFSEGALKRLADDLGDEAVDMTALPEIALLAGGDLNSPLTKSGWTDSV